VRSLPKRECGDRTPGDAEIKGGTDMIEPINKITCDWCGKFELSANSVIPKEFFLVTIKHTPAEKEQSTGVEPPEVEKVLLCTACRNAIESVKNLRMKERRENKHSQFADMNWSTVDSRFSLRDKACA